MACISEAVASAEAAVAASSPCGDADGVTMDAALLDEQMVVTAEHFDHALQRAAPSSMRHLAPSVEAPLTSWADIGGQHAVKQALQV
jgi:SpoVK/Ycf46/Vps4 family AAA+-type ATPase